jgi:hypothetical protein
MIFFIYLWLICTLVTAGMAMYTFMQLDVWALEKFIGIRLTEDEYKKVQNLFIGICVSPLSILLLFYMLYNMVRVGK